MSSVTNLWLIGVYELCLSIHGQHVLVEVRIAIHLDTRLLLWLVTPVQKQSHFHFVRTGVFRFWYVMIRDQSHFAIRGGENNAWNGCGSSLLQSLFIRLYIGLQYMMLLEDTLDEYYE